MSLLHQRVGFVVHGGALHGRMGPEIRESIWRTVLRLRPSVLLLRRPGSVKTVGNQAGVLGPRRGYPWDPRILPLLFLLLPQSRQKGKGPPRFRGAPAFDPRVPVDRGPCPRSAVQSDGACRAFDGSS